MEKREIAKLFGTVGFKIDFKALQQLDDRLKAITNRIKSLQTSQLTQVSRSLREVTKTERESIKNERERLRLQGQRVEVARKEESVRTQAARTDLVNFRRQVSHQRQLAAQQKASAREAARADRQASALVGPTMPAAVRRERSRGVTPNYPTYMGGGSVGRPAQGGISGFVSGLMGGPGAFARGLIPGLGAGFAVREIATSGRRQVGQELAFEAMLGSAAAGNAEMDWVKSLSNRIGLVSVDAADQYKGILAAGMNNKDVGVAGARKIFEATSSYGRIMGLDPDRMKRAQMAISQMLSKGKVSSEELRLQLAEHMPAAIGMFAKAVTGSSENTAELWKMMEEGRVISSEVLPKVADLMLQQANSGDAMKKSMETSTVAQARFTNAWNDFIKKIFKGGGDKGLASLFNTGAIAIETLGNVITRIILPALNALAAVLGPVLTMFNEFVQVVGYLIEESPVLMGLIGALTVGLVNAPLAIRGIGMAFNVLMRSPAILAFVSAMLMLQDLMYYMMGAPYESLIGDLINKYNPQAAKRGREEGPLGAIDELTTQTLGGLGYLALTELGLPESWVMNIMPFVDKVVRGDIKVTDHTTMYGEPPVSSPTTPDSVGNTNLNQTIQINVEGSVDKQAVPAIVQGFKDAMTNLQAPGVSQ